MAEPLNATFFAFRRRERGGVLTTLTIAYVVLALVLFGLFVVLNLQGISDYFNWYAGMLGAAMENAADPGAMMPPSSVMALGPAYLLLMLSTYILLAAYEAGCLRWMIHGEVDGLFGLSLGADTWRVWFGYWVWLLLLVAFYIVFAVVFAAVFVGSMAGLQSAPSDAGPGAVLVSLGMMLAVLVVPLYFGVRFAPAAATSVACRRFAFFDAWTVSKGRWWALFGAFLLLFLMFYVLYLIVGGGLLFAMMSTAQGAIGRAEPQNAQEAFQAFANPAWAAMVVGFVVIMTVAVMTLCVAIYGVNARAALVALQEGKIRER